MLCYDLPGRGFTPHRRGKQDAAFFLNDLVGLLKDQQIQQVDLLIGYSMGGSIATAFTAAKPDRVERLVLLAPAGLFHDLGPLADAIQRVPVLGDWAMLVFGGAILRRQNAGASPFAQAQRDETRKRGYLGSVLSSMRNMLRTRQAGLHKEIAALGVPVLAVWGQEDDVMPVSNVGRLAEANPKAQQVTLEGADHGLPHSHADEVAAAIRIFLKRTTW